MLCNPNSDQIDFSMTVIVTANRIKISFLALILVVAFSFISPVNLFNPLTAKAAEITVDDNNPPESELSPQDARAEAQRKADLNSNKQDEVASSSLLKNPLQNSGGLPQIIGKIIKGLLTLSGAASLLIFTWGGLQMIISQGDSTKYESGKNTLVWAVIGLVVIFTSYALLATIIATLAG